MKIEFIPSSFEIQETVQCPFSIKKIVPDWYKKVEILNSKNFEFDDNNNVKNVNIKNCMPFFDAISSGYVQTTWTDIYVEVKNNFITLRTACGPEIIQTRDKVSVPIDSLFYPIEFIWKTPWIPKVPKGYSVLITHPMNRLDLPFMSMSGIVDSDSFYHTPSGNFPLYIKNGFTGLIPKGTPMYQIIPIKRDSWELEQKLFDEKTYKIRDNFMKKFFYGAYKKNFWNKKFYN
jgi:hypothetical protein